MTKKINKRTRVRYPAVIEAFCSRFRQAAAKVGVQQADLAKALGDFRHETISRLARNVATTLSIDFLVKLAEWADGNGISVRWLVLGAGPMMKDDLPKQSNLGEHLNQVMAYSMLCLLAERLGVDMEGIVPGWMVSVDLPGGGIASHDLASSIEQLKVKRTKPKGGQK